MATQRKFQTEHHQESNFHIGSTLKWLGGRRTLSGLERLFMVVPMVLANSNLGWN